MRIHDQNPVGGNGPGGIGANGSRAAGQTQGVPPPGQVGGSGGAEGARGAVHSPDRVSLSNLAASLQPEAADREAELARLSELFDRGLYEPDTAVVAEQMIEEGLSPMPGETEAGAGENG